MGNSTAKPVSSRINSYRLQRYANKLKAEDRPSVVDSVAFEVILPKAAVSPANSESEIQQSRSDSDRIDDVRGSESPRALAPKAEQKIKSQVVSPTNTEIRPDKRIKIEQSQYAEEDHRTPSKQHKHLRRRLDGSPILPVDSKLPCKTVYLIRHGHSQGQAAAKNGLDRKTDKRLRDCNLTERGIKEALEIPTLFTEDELSSIQLVYASPLTRALHTAVLGFPNKNITCHFELREIGTKAPENIPRSMASVVRDIKSALDNREDGLFVDVTTHRPVGWPRDHIPDVIRKERLRKVFQWLYKETEETNFAIVCHYNVIRAALSDEGNRVRPKNGKVIPCHLNSNGELSLDLKRKDPSGRSFCFA